MESFFLGFYFLFYFPFKNKNKISGDSQLFFQKSIFHQIKSESRRSSGDAREKCGSTVLLILWYESVWLHHIDVFFKITVQEHYLDIHLLYLIIEMHRNGQKYSNGLEHGYWCESLLIVETKFLIIHLNISIYPYFHFVDPLTLYGFYPFRCFYQDPRIR